MIVLPWLLLAAAAITPLTDVTIRAASPQHDVMVLSPDDMFRLAEQAERLGDLGTAEGVYRALSTNPSREIHNEARFRLAQILTKEHQLARAAALYRQILDEQPDAARVRVELAGVLALLGDRLAAAQELRRAEINGLPRQLLPIVRGFTAALRDEKTVGGSARAMFTADSNINRATRSETLGTIIGDFILDQNAREQSGAGLVLSGDAYRRIRIGSEDSVLAALSGSGNFYGKSRFDNAAVSGNVGPELWLGADRLNLSGNATARWYGGRPYSMSAGGRIDFLHPLPAATELRAFAAADHITNHFNFLEGGWQFSGSVGLEKALSKATGIGAVLSGIRQDLQVSGYSTTAAQASLYAYTELSEGTLAGSVSLGRLTADQRLLLYPRKRDETSFRTTIAAVFHKLEIAHFSPTAQLTLERNRSTIELYDYRRVAFELGVTRIF